MVFLVALAATGMFHRTAAQTTAATAYSDLNQLRVTGAPDDQIYQTLHECFRAAMSQLDNSEPGSDEFLEARTILADIHPLLRTGAFYYSGNNNKNGALMFACDYMDIPTHKAFQGYAFKDDDQYANLAVFAATGVYNQGKHAKAIPYLQAYLETGEQSHRREVFMSLAKAYSERGDKALAASVLKQGIAAFPTDFEMISMAVNNAIDLEDNDILQEYVSLALNLRPDDETLLNIQGKLYEDTQQFQSALNIYNQLLRSKPNSLQINKHVALNYYNLGVLNYNKASLETKSSSTKKLQKLANEYFSAAAEILETVVHNDLSSARYLQALATAYSCLGAEEQLQTTNERLSSMGMATVADNIVPQIISEGNSGAKKKSQQGLENLMAGNATAASSGSSFTSPSYSSGIHASAGGRPKYSEFAKGYVESRIASWQTKDPYETITEYQTRVTEETRDAKIRELLKDAEQEYIATYTKGIKLNNMKLKPYDADNQVFLIESNYGELVVPVPRDNGEAKVFESGWAGMQFKDPEFYINNDELLLSSLTFVTPMGQTYHFDADKGLNYTETVVNMSFGNIADYMYAANQGGSGSNAGVKKNSHRVTLGNVVSDVDKDIPRTKEINERTFAVVIANENYNLVAPVPFALNDGETFAKYCNQVLGLPENNIRVYKDASFGTMLRALRDIRAISDAFHGDIKVIFYYAGHGVPNESTKDAFLLPIDADGMTTDGCYSLNRLYSELGDLNTLNTVVFLDACFSGTNRDGDMLASARGLVQKPKKEVPKGNMIVFSAASDDETAFPYEDKGHGLFTYFLLKRLKEKKGNVELGDLADFIKNNVRQQSVLVNHKSQTPTVAAALAVEGDWEKIKLGR